MPAPAWEDLGEFLQDDDFAVPAVITLQGGGTIALSVVFDDPNVNAEMGDAYTRDTTLPQAMCREDLVAAVKRGDTIAITFHTGARTFDILTAPQPDGTGMAILELAKP